MKVAVRVQLDFGAHHVCIENAHVMIWLSIGADMVPERPAEPFGKWLSLVRQNEDGLKLLALDLHAADSGRSTE